MAFPLFDLLRRSRRFRAASPVSDQVFFFAGKSANELGNADDDIRR